MRAGKGCTLISLKVERYLEITSKENPRFRSFVALHDRKVARAQGKVFIEGLRLCEDALLSGLAPETVLFRKGKEDLLKEWEKKYPNLSGVEKFAFSENLFSKIAQTVNPQGIALVVRNPGEQNMVSFDDEHARFIVLEHLQDPGNMGTIIRMADAFGYTSVLFTEDSVDPYNEKVLRASMGSCFHIPLISFPDSASILDKLGSAGIPSIGAHLNGEDLRTVHLPSRAALWIGNEANGLSVTTSSVCDILGKIPMRGRAESLNAASAASILGYLLAFGSDS